MTATWLDSRDDVLLPEAGGDDPASNPQSEATLSEEGIEALRVPVTVSTLRVEKTLKGAAMPGSIVEVHQTGGMMDGKLYVEDGTTLLKDVRSGKTLLFLSDFGQGVFAPINPSEGVWALSGSDDRPSAVAPKAGPFEIQSLDEVAAEVATRPR